MPNEKEFRPLLDDVLTTPETLAKRVSLGQMIYHPGYAVLVELANEVCNRANTAVIALDPTDDKYDTKIKALQQEARTMSKFAAALFKSIDFYANYAQVELQMQEEALNQEAQKVVQQQYSN